MSNLIVRIFGNLSTRIMFIFYMSIILITGFFLIFGYYNQLNLLEARERDKLTGIVSSLSMAIDSQTHLKMTTDNGNKDDITTISENDTYHAIHEILKTTVQANGLNSPIYTLVYDNKDKVFKFGVTSDAKPYYFHDYTNFPSELIDKMDKGGNIPLYESENGMWLSAFYPLKDTTGQTIGLIEADTEFSSFISSVRSTYLKQSLYSLGAILLLAIILIPYTKRILKEDENQKRKLLSQAQVIQQKNRDITDSINYALKIQSSILPSQSKIGESFEDFGILYKPKDIVAGDFYFVETNGNDIYVAAADCTGHGVPGAMVSVICSNALSYSIHERKLVSTNEILDTVRDIVVEKFKGSPDGIKDGMDISLCRINHKNKELEYSGANNSVYIISNNQFIELKANRQPVGQFEHAVPFDAQSVDLNRVELLYLFTDGYADQFGGEKGKKLKYKTFKDYLIENKDLSMQEQMQQLSQKFDNWKKENDQVDDVCVLGIRINDKRQLSN